MVLFSFLLFFGSHTLFGIIFFSSPFFPKIMANQQLALKDYFAKIHTFGNSLLAYNHGLTIY